MERSLIAVISCWKNLELMEAIRATWAPLAAEYYYDVRFFVGRYPFNKYGLATGGYSDVVVLDADDGYLGLPCKVQLMCEWASHRYETLCKVDDDCYVVPELLSRRPVLGYDYVGRFRHSSGGYPALYASGFAYHLSSRSMVALAQTPLNKDWPEDRWVGNCLAFNGIAGHTDMESYVAVAPTLPPAVIHRCNVKYAAVFCEFKRPDDMREMHRMNVAMPKPFIKVTPPKLVALHTVTAEQYYAAPTDVPQKRRV